MSIADILGLVGVIFALVGIVLSYLAIRDGTRLKNSSERLAENTAKLLDTTGSVLNRLSEVDRRLSTRPVGPFPEHVSAISKLLCSAQQEILIACQAAGYAATSAPALYTEYEHAIRQRALAGVQTKVIIPTAAQMDLLRREQFADRHQWEIWSGDPRHQQSLRSLERRLGLHRSIASLSDYLGAVNEEELRARRELARFSDVKEVSVLMPLQMWVADSKSAMFSVKSSFGSVVSTAFETVDSSLVDALISTWRFYDSLK